MSDAAMMNEAMARMDALQRDLDKMTEKLGPIEKTVQGYDRLISDILAEATKGEAMCMQPVAAAHRFKQIIRLCEQAGYRVAK